jgi:hypothetical protein
VNLPVTEISSHGWGSRREGSPHRERFTFGSPLRICRAGANGRDGDQVRVAQLIFQSFQLDTSSGDISKTWFIDY